MLRNSVETFFIVIDGIDGCGKTTIAQLLLKYLHGIPKKVILTREPGGSYFFKPIRQLLLKSETNIEILTETLLFFADRYAPAGLPPGLRPPRRHPAAAVAAPLPPPPLQCPPTCPERSPYQATQ